MKKGEIFALVFGILILGVVAYFLVFQNNFGLTGFTIFESQPNATQGNDTTIMENTDVNFGTRDILYIGKYNIYESRAILKFDVSSIPITDTVTSGKLSIYVNYSTNISENITIRAYILTENWDENQANYTHASDITQWSISGGVYDSSILDSVNLSQTGYYNFTITSATKGWVNGTYSNYGIILIALSPENTKYRAISSSDNANSSQRPKLTIEHTSNAIPEINNLSTDSSSSAPKQVGSTITFTINWSDLDSSQVKTFVCNTSNINSSGCQDKTFCSASLSSSNPLTCAYTILSSDNKTTTFYAKVCDLLNCSTANTSVFYVNHVPNIIVVQPNGGETINQSQGNYSIKFNVSDSDSDSLNATIYYSSTSGARQYLIVQNINLSNYCTDTDQTTSTTNNCTYSWNSSGIYGTYYLDILVNESYSSNNDSSDSSFNVRSIEDNQAPRITAQWISKSNFYSGEQGIVYANVTEENPGTVWATTKSPSSAQTDYDMSNTSSTYSANITLGEIGAWQYKIFAQDLLGNLNSSMDWQNISVTSPNATAQNEEAPSIALPYHTIKIQGSLNASNPLKNVYAYLNVPSGFTFLTDYPQNYLLGNLSYEEIKNSTWYLSVPLTEGNYTLNITYTDQYSNQWNSSNIYVEITSSIGDYGLTISGYPEVVGGNNYYVEGDFKKSNEYVNPSSITISLYDPVGNLIVGPVAMTQKTTGKYNYTYTVPSSATEGEWETRLNATRSGENYYANQFWQVVGGPFDVKDIVISDAVVPDLTISVTTENTGDLNKDLTLVWNLTKVSNDEVLDEGSDTFMVSANSVKTWTVNPSTTYVGQVKITFLGYYSGTEKAGAYTTFSTSSSPAEPPSGSSSGGGGGGGGAVSGKITEEVAELTIKEFEEIIGLTKNVKKNVSLIIENTGTKKLTNITLTLNGLEKSYYSVAPELIKELKSGESVEFEISFLIEDYSGEKTFVYLITTSELTKEQSAKINVVSMGNYFLQEIENLMKKINELKEKGDAKINKEIGECEKILNSVKEDIEKEEFINANEDIEQARECINKIKEKLVPEKKGMENIFAWRITWGLIIFLIIIVVLIGYLIYRKFKILSFFDEKNTEPKLSDKKIPDSIDKKIKEIEDKLGED